MLKIDSLENKKVLFWKKLKEKKYRDEENLFIVEGDHSVNEALSHNIVKEVISLDDIDTSCDCYLVSEKIMKLLTNQVTSPRIMAVCYKLKEEEVRGKVLILDNIQDPGNLGTIIRSAVAFNFKNIILSNDSVDLYNPKVIRSTEGLLFNINILRRDLKTEIVNLKNKGYHIIGSSLNTDNYIINDVTDIALIIGNEGNGIKKEILEMCDEVIKIPISLQCESLNAGVAASILMYEMRNYQ